MIFEEIRLELRQLKTTLRELRKFGITMAIILGILTGITLYKGSWLFPYFLGLAGAFFVIGILKPILLKYIYLGWMAIAITMGFFVTKVILSIVFYGIFTIVGIIARLVNQDMLDQQYDPDAETYWKQHEKPQDSRKHLERQF